MAKKKLPRWVEVSKAEAEFHPLYGLGGWTAFLGYTMAASAILAVLAEPGIVTWVVAAVEMLFCVLIYRKSRYFYWPFITVYSAFFFFLLSTLAWVNFADGAEVWIVVQPSIVCAARVGYAVFSRRVHVTFRHQVKPRELHLVWSNARARHFQETGEILLAKKTRPSPEAHYKEGNRNAKKGDFREAIGNFTRSIEINPEYAEAFRNRGGAYQALGDMASAVNDYKRAYELGLRSEWMVKAIETAAIEK